MEDLSLVLSVSWPHRLPCVAGFWTSERSLLQSILSYYRNTPSLHLCFSMIVVRDQLNHTRMSSNGQTIWSTIMWILSCLNHKWRPSCRHYKNYYCDTHFSLNFSIYFCHWIIDLTDWENSPTEILYSRGVIWAFSQSSVTPPYWSQFVMKLKKI